MFAFNDQFTAFGPSIFERRFIDGRKRAPNYQLDETESAFTLNLELPGVNPEELKLDLVENHLNISAEPSVGVSERTCNYRWRVPKSANTDQLSASLKHGILNITVPKTAAAKPRRITLST